MPAHIGYVRPELLSDKNKRKGRTVRLLKTAGMFGLVGLDMLESLRLTASEESFDWNCWCVDGAMKESGRGLKMRNERREWARRRAFMGQCKQNEDFGSGTAASRSGGQARQTWQCPPAAKNAGIRLSSPQTLALTYVHTVVLWQILPNRALSPSPIPTPTTSTIRLPSLVRPLSNVSVQTPHGTFLARLPTPGMSATRSYFLTSSINSS